MDRNDCKWYVIEFVCVMSSNQYDINCCFNSVLAVSNHFVSVVLVIVVRFMEGITHLVRDCTALPETNLLLSADI